MDSFKSICVVHNIENSFVSCYIKEFFKWIGVSYVELLYDVDMPVFFDGKGIFDVVVDVGNNFTEEERHVVENSLGSKVIYEVIESETKDNQILNNILGKIANDFVREQCPMLSELAQIYEKYNLVSYLFDYTFVLFQNIDDDNYNCALKKLKGALSEVEKHLKLGKEKCENYHDEHFMAYALYAKYSCQNMINRLLNIRNDFLEYDVYDYLHQVNEIYDCDPDFYKVEYLKASAVSMDRLYRAYGKSYLETCIRECPVSICRSFQYYGLAKWLEQDEQPYEAGKFYRKSYETNPGNIKAIFKVAIDDLNRNKIEQAKMSLKRIISRWVVGKDIYYISPRDLEYIYKANMLLYDIDKISAFYKNNADNMIAYVKDVLKGESDNNNNFFTKLYPDNELRKQMCILILLRFDAQCLENM